MTGRTGDPPPGRPDLADIIGPERLSHAIYGGIITTAALVAEWGHVEDGAEVVSLLVVAGLVLYIAHVYSVLMALEGDKVRRGTLWQLVRTGRDEAAVVAVVAVPIVLFALAELEVIGLTTAFRLSIGFMLVFLFAVGYAHARAAGRPAWINLVAGLLGSTFGLIVVFLESLLD